MDQETRNCLQEIKLWESQNYPKTKIVIHDDLKHGVLVEFHYVNGMVYVYSTKTKRLAHLPFVILKKKKRGKRK